VSAILLAYRRSLLTARKIEGGLVVEGGREEGDIFYDGGYT